MNLETIKQALKPQFVWLDFNQLEANKIMYNGIGSGGIGQVVFIGIANLNGLKQKEVMEFLNIETRQEHFNKLKSFREAIKNYSLGKRDKETQTIQFKTSLAINYINRHTKTTSQPLSNFNY